MASTTTTTPLYGDGLRNLPTELRLKVYGHVIGNNPTMMLEAHAGGKYNQLFINWRRWKLPKNLLHIAGLLRSEALIEFYKRADIRIRFSLAPESVEFVADMLRFIWQQIQRIEAGTPFARAFKSVMLRPLSRCAMWEDLPEYKPLALFIREVGVMPEILKPDTSILKFTSRGNFQFRLPGYGKFIRPAVRDVMEVGLAKDAQGNQLDENGVAARFDEVVERLQTKGMGRKHLLAYRGRAAFFAAHEAAEARQQAEQEAKEAAARVAEEDGEDGEEEEEEEEEEQENFDASLATEIGYNKDHWVAISLQFGEHPPAAMTALVPAPGSWSYMGMPTSSEDVSDSTTDHHGDLRQPALPPRVKRSKPTSSLRPQRHSTAQQAAPFTSPSLADCFEDADAPPSLYSGIQDEDHSNIMSSETPGFLDPDLLDGDLLDEKAFYDFHGAYGEAGPNRSAKRARYE